MKVILKRDVDNLGEAGDVVDVANGYGNNYLVPRGLAMRATKGALADAEAMQRSRQRRAERSRAAAEEQQAELERAPVVLTANADDEGTLYGSVGVTQVAKGISEQLGAKVEKKRIRLDRPIKETGVHDVPVQLHADVVATVRVEIAPA
ncbi:50S ribosomal protein L9 [Egibacter rhizosphaerae]|uniref:Large ribosomal subunit protein bL9 n=1 Tax=Egibacter rhizosphaerae TaxID=1670831 RepID=A0A411YFY0_9ACTN|nr:50S ribosomal protein L9 [Egibacter rhizosphaerae]QBI20047.1 50S ribosomal protein L9 [Egibacter rhizosphaerae]